MPLTQAQLEQAFRTHREMLFRFLLRLTRSPATAEDLLQDAFVSLWTHRARYVERGELAGYLRRIAYRLFLNRVQSESRRARREQIASERARPEAPGASQVDRADDARHARARLDAMLATLPAEQREAFLLFRVCGLTCAEVGRLLDVSPKTIESRVLRASRRLRSLLAPAPREAVPE